MKLFQFITIMKIDALAAVTARGVLATNTFDYQRGWINGATERRTVRLDDASLLPRDAGKAIAEQSCVIDTDTRDERWPEARHFIG